jgi:CBS-domain-containing membrane protein
MSPRTALAADVGRRGPAQDGASSSFHLLTAGEVMSGPPEVIDADESMWQAALRLGDGSHRRLVVLDEGRLAGVIDEKTLTDHWPRIPFVARQRTLDMIVPGRVPGAYSHDLRTSAQHARTRASPRAFCSAGRHRRRVGHVGAVAVMAAPRRSRSCRARRAGDLGYFQGDVGEALP